MPRRIAVFGGSFNPPGSHHVAIAEALSREFDLVMVVPCGPRPDKLETNEIDPVFRAAMADLAFGHLPKCEVDLFDLEHTTFTRSIDLEQRYQSSGEVHHVVGGDLVEGGADGRSAVQRQWHRGQELWQAARFVVVTRPGCDLNPSDLPPNHLVFELHESGSSSALREQLRTQRLDPQLLPPKILAYIQRYGLYRETIPNTASRGRLDQVRAFFHVDQRNPTAVDLADRFHRFRNEDDPNCILVFGGDGSMLHAIRQHWRRRLPFFGINTGHIGFLMNDDDEVLNGSFPPGDVMIRQLPMLFVTTRDDQGRETNAYAFNDVWVERSGSQSAWLRVLVDGVERIPRLVGDGLLASTAAGSTAYARSMGAPPLPANSPSWLLVGSNVMLPLGWKSALLSPEAVVEAINLDPEKRPMTSYLDGHPGGATTSFKVRLSRVAAVELAF
jgi:nicotinate (nicotinamide) nucleotide adenylyltransferase